jgi:hypothetical protein
MLPIIEIQGTQEQEATGDRGVQTTGETLNEIKDIGKVSKEEEMRPGEEKPRQGERWRPTISNVRV